MAEIILGVSGSIAAYKAADLTSKLVQSQHKVHVVMTSAASKLVDPNTFLYLSGNPVHNDMFDKSQAGPIEHIALNDRAELTVIAPATANVIARMAHGLANDFLTTLLLASSSPILLCPAMNPNMWKHPATQNNVATLRSFGYHFLQAKEGRMACGHVGPGRMAEPIDILEHIEMLLSKQTRAPVLQAFAEQWTFQKAPSKALREQEQDYRNDLQSKGSLSFRGCFRKNALSGLCILQASNLKSAKELSKASPFAKDGRASFTIQALHE